MHKSGQSGRCCITFYDLLLRRCPRFAALQKVETVGKPWIPNLSCSSEGTLSSPRGFYRNSEEGFKRGSFLSVILTKFFQKSLRFVAAAVVRKMSVLNSLFNRSTLGARWFVRSFNYVWLIYSFFFHSILSFLSYFLDSSSSSDP